MSQRSLTNHNEASRGSRPLKPPKESPERKTPHDTLHVGDVHAIMLDVANMKPLGLDHLREFFERVRTVCGEVHREKPAPMPPANGSWGHVGHGPNPDATWPEHTQSLRKDGPRIFKMLQQAKCVDSIQ